MYPYDWWVAVKWKGDYALFSVLSNSLQNCFKQKDSAINASAITAVTTASLPWSHEVALLQTITYAVVEKGMQNKGEV